MYDFLVYNIKDKISYKVVIDSYFKARKYYIKLKHSNNLQLVATDFIFED